jgi:Glycosyltransferase family 10 (fucosyltransferase) C-term
MHMKKIDYWSVFIVLIFSLILLTILLCNENNNKQNNETPKIKQNNETPKIKHDIRIRFFSDLCESETISNIFIKNFINSEPKPKRIEYVNDETYTHCVIINTATPIITIPKENVLGIAFEPPVFLEISQNFKDFAENFIGTYYIGDNTGLLAPFVNHIGFIWHLPVPKVVPMKNKIMSITFSTKKDLDGHIYRHKLIDKILKSNLDIDIWGKGCEDLLHLKDKRIKGEFSEIEPFESYQFTIAIENCALHSYVSEKFVNALMYETVPLYYGAKCVDDLFPNTFIRLSGNLNSDFETIQKVATDPSKYQKSINRLEVAKKMNIGHHLDEIF